MPSSQRPQHGQLDDNGGAELPEGKPCPSTEPFFRSLLAELVPVGVARFTNSNLVVPQDSYS